MSAPAPHVSSQSDGSFTIPQSTKPKADPDHPSLVTRILNDRRWLWVGGVAMVLAAGLLAVIFVLRLSGSTNNPSVITNTPTPPPTTNNYTPSHAEEDNSFFASQPLTLLYYSFFQTSNSKNVFQSTPRDTDSRFMDIGFPDRYQFSTSPDGHYLIRWQSTKIELAESATPTTFNELFALTDSGLSLHSVAWSDDSKMLAVSYTSETSDKKLVNRVVLIDVANKKNAQLVEMTADYAIELRAVVDNRLVYYVQDRNGLYRTLTEFSIETQKVNREVTQFDNGGLLAKLQFDNKMIWAYGYEENRVVRYNVATGAKEVIYEISRSCPRGQPNSSSVTSLTASPSAETLLFTVVPTACRSSAASSQDLRPRQIAWSVEEKKMIKELFNPTQTKQTTTAHWSPDESLVWMQYDSQTVVMTQAASLESWPIPPTERSVLTKERPLFLGWLVN